MLGPVAYKIVEYIESLAAIISFGGMLIVVLLSPAVAKVAGEYFSGLVPFSSGFNMLPPNFDKADMGTFITLICYTGAGGIWNILYSFWVRDKNAGMSAHIGRVTSPITGEPEPIPGVGVAFPDTPENRKRWKDWVTWLWCDNLFGVFLNTLTIVLTSLLTFAVLRPEYLVKGAEALPTGFKLVVVQAEWFGHLWGDVGRAILYIVGFFFLLDTYITALDGVGRMFASNLYTIPGVPEKIEYRKIYYYLVTIYTVIGAITVLLEKPGFLIILTGVGNMFLMVIYTWLFFYQNWVLLPKIHPAGKTVRPGWIPFIFLLISAIMFTYAFALYINVQFLGG